MNNKALLFCKKTSFFHHALLRKKKCFYSNSKLGSLFIQGIFVEWEVTRERNLTCTRSSRKTEISLQGKMWNMWHSPLIDLIVCNWIQLISIANHFISNFSNDFLQKHFDEVNWKFVSHFTKSFVRCFMGKKEKKWNLANALTLSNLIAKYWFLLLQAINCSNCFKLSGLKIISFS